MAQKPAKLESNFSVGYEDGRVYYFNNVLHHAAAVLEGARWAIDLALGKMDSYRRTSIPVNRP